MIQNGIKRNFYGGSILHCKSSGPTSLFKPRFAPGTSGMVSGKFVPMLPWITKILVGERYEIFVEELENYLWLKGLGNQQSLRKKTSVRLANYENVCGFRVERHQSDDGRHPMFSLFCLLDSNGQDFKRPWVGIVRLRSNDSTHSPSHPLLSPRSA